MGTTLTGTTPQDTYDSLIKVTDNGPLSGTAKYLSDGLGNDSALALSTGNIGIGTTSPSQPLVVFKANAADDIGQIIQQGANGTAAFLNIVGNNDAGASFNRITSSTSGGTAHWQIGGGGTASTMVLLTGGSERVRIASGGDVFVNKTSLSYATVGCAFEALGTVSATRASDVSAVFARNTTDGDVIQFRKDNVTKGSIGISADGISIKLGGTAAANELDDYEEGTWTMGIAFGGASVGVTTSANTGTYTKIGRQVTVNGYISLTSKGSSTGGASITGLPFTIPNSFQNYAAASLWINNITFANQYNAVGSVNTTRISLEEVTELGVSSGLTNADFANNSEIIVSLTYFV